MTNRMNIEEWVDWQSPPFNDRQKYGRNGSQDYAPRYTKYRNARPNRSTCDIGALNNSFDRDGKVFRETREMSCGSFYAKESTTMTFHREGNRYEHTVIFDHSRRGLDFSYPFFATMNERGMRGYDVPSRLDFNGSIEECEDDQRDDSWASEVQGDRWRSGGRRDNNDRYDGESVRSGSKSQTSSASGRSSKKSGSSDSTPRLYGRSGGSQQSHSSGPSWRKDNYGNDAAW